MNPYESPSSSSDGETAAVVASRRLCCFIFPVLAILPGGYAGFQCMLPAPPEPGEGTCGVPELLAMVIGAPVGAALFAMTAGVLGRIVDHMRT
jgi:hypothetical protein